MLERYLIEPFALTYGVEGLRISIGYKTDSLISNRSAGAIFGLGGLDGSVATSFEKHDN